MSRLDALAATNPVSIWRPVAWTLMALLTALVSWSYYAQLEEVAVVPGEIVPQSQVKVVQHLEGGIIQSLDVEDGDLVVSGDKLIQLDLGVSPMNKEELQVKLDSLILNRARLEAEAKGTALTLDPALVERRPGFARAETEAYEAHRRELGSALAVHGEKVIQEEQKLAELRAERQTLRGELGRTREILAISEGLLEEGLTSRLEHIQVLRQVEKFEGGLRAIGEAIPGAEAAIAEAREKLREETLVHQSAAYEELGKVELAIARTREVLTQATDLVRRTVIRSPIDGVVKNLRYHTIGGVVKPGEPIMEIVPVAENVVVEARLHPIDRGYVRVGQAATVKVTTYDYIRYGGLAGTVIQIAPDSSLDEEGAPYFRVVVQTEKAYLGEESDDLRITPGMQASVDIHTGERSVMDYLLRPVLKLRHEAFQER
jgi:adhesin transport system membrane fusion protein